MSMMSSGQKYPSKKAGAGKYSQFSWPLLSVLNTVLFALSLYFYLVPVHPPVPNTVINQPSEAVGIVATPVVVPNVVPSSKLVATVMEPCNDPDWCSIEMPKKSYFKFPPPTDPVKWRRAQLQAISGEQVLLKRIVKVFPNHYDYLDGDISFRKLHYAFDFFIDEKNDLSPLRDPKKPARPSAKVGTASSVGMTKPRRLEEEERPTLVNPVESVEMRRLEEEEGPKMVNGVLMYPWEIQGRRVIPEPYDFRGANRSAVVSVGYTAYTRDSQTYFSGNRVGGAFISRATFFKQWRAVKDDIDLPFIAICSLNENWGFISTNFPNRTAGWGQCCNTPRDKEVYDFLNHPKTLMLATNQHYNVSHPKLITLPRGIPITWGHTRIILWDAQRNTIKVPKKVLLFAAASSWGPRPQILRCISSKVPAKDFDGHVKTPVTNRLDRPEYYEKLGTAMFGVGLPGLGYDCFRAWELMTMGTIVVLEKMVGFDRTMWRLPALFLEDFDEITPLLLRTAYLEALYRADDFEYHRLTQSFWYSVIANVSAAQSHVPLVETFPMEAEEAGFSRPRVPYECGKTNTCGKGTNRTPKSSC